MRIILAAAVCLAILYAIDDLYFSGQYFTAVGTMLRDALRQL